MPRRQFIDKKKAQTFQLVFRSQDDPRIHDAEASNMVFTEKTDLNREKVKNRKDLEEEFGVAIRENEGEAANYGIYFDDTEYDYMQHMREIGANNGAYFVEAPTKTKKGKMKLEDALKDLDLDGASHADSAVSTASSLLPEELLPSDYVRPSNYQDQQDVQDAIAGFQPDMDPRLREVLEALNDEAYVDDDEDIFDALAQDAEEVDIDVWEQSPFEDNMEDEDGWESDHTIKAGHAEPLRHIKASVGTADLPQDAPPDDPHGDGDWMAEFSKFKKDVKSAPAQKRLDLQSSVMTTATNLTSGRKKKRKGALTATSGYSMSSSVLARTEGQSVLDARFDKIEEEYADDEDGDDTGSMFSGMSGMSGMSGISKASSQAPQLVRADFNSLMGEFLQGHSQVGKRRIRVGRPQTGLEQLDDIRKGLGPARFKTTSH